MQFSWFVPAANKGYCTLVRASFQESVVWLVFNDIQCALLFVCPTSKYLTTVQTFEPWYLCRSLPFKSSQNAVALAWKPELVQSLSLDSTLLKALCTPLTATWQRADVGTSNLAIIKVLSMSSPTNQGRTLRKESWLFQRLQPRSSANLVLSSMNDKLVTGPENGDISWSRCQPLP